MAELQRCFPACRVRVVVSSDLHGPNYKAVNLERLQAAAAFDYLVLSDADVLVGPDYLRKVAPLLAGLGVGLVTCPYAATFQGGLKDSKGSWYRLRRYKALQRIVRYRKCSSLTRLFGLV